MWTMQLEALSLEGREATTENRLPCLSVLVNFYILRLSLRASVRRQNFSRTRATICTEERTTKPGARAYGSCYEASTWTGFAFKFDSSWIIHVSLAINGLHLLHQGHPTNVLFKISFRRSKYCLKFSIAWIRLKISRWAFHSRYNFWSLSKKFLRFSEVCFFHILLLMLRLFS